MLVKEETSLLLLRLAKQEAKSLETLCR